MTMLQDRPTISAAFVEELARFGALVRSLSVDELALPSRCAGWTVGDVAGHFIGSIAEIADGNLDGQGTEPVTARQVADRKGRTAAELADELAGAAEKMAALAAVLDDAAWAAPAGGGFDGSLGLGVEALLFDGVVHADDIAAATGRTVTPTAAGVLASVSHVAHFLPLRGWGPAILDLDGIEAVTVGDGAPSEKVTGDPMAFVRVATGRQDPATLGLDETVNIYREG